MAIDDTIFYKIVEKACLSMRGGTVLITVPSALFSNCISRTVMDDNLKVFEIGTPAHFAFRNGNGIPKWYLETVTVEVKEVHDIDEIGEYISVFTEQLKDSCCHEVGG